MLTESKRLYIIDNTVSISLVRFAVNIKVGESDYDTCSMVVTDGNQNNIQMKFNTLEDAFQFTEESVSSSKTFGEIEASYNEFYREQDRYGYVLVKRKK